MKYYSTNKSVPTVSFQEVIFKGLPDDNGLYMPETIDKLPKEFFDRIPEMPLHEIAFQVASRFIEDEIPEMALRKIVEDTLNFDIPLVEVEDNIYSLELYHGPTCAFKALFNHNCMLRSELILVMSP